MKRVILGTLKDMFFWLIGLLTGIYMMTYDTEWDYKIELEQDHIDIWSETNGLEQIHPDSLEEYIERDNL